MCPSSVIGWFDFAILGGALTLLFAAPGTKRRYGLVIICLLALIHFYELLSTDWIFGRLHVVSTPYLMWALFPLAPPAVIAGVSFLATRIAGRGAVAMWMPAAAGCVIAVVAVVVWIEKISPNQPRLPGRGPLGLPPIAHVPANEGPIVDYLQTHIGLKPGDKFRGYATTFLGASDGLVRKSTRTPDDRMTYDAYLAARSMLFEHFGNSFQMMDLWNNSIPTLEDVGQWVSQQMYYFTRELLAEPQDQSDKLQAIILLYRFRPSLLRALGVRFVIADGTLADPSIELVKTETGKSGATVNLYELKGANLGQFSPTQVVWAADFSAAARALREHVRNLEKHVVVLGAPEPQPELVSAYRVELVALRDGYRLRASAPGRAMLVLPVQFSHCWRIEHETKIDPPRILRANIVQTAILFKDNVDVRMHFDFQPWRPSCRFQDGKEVADIASIARVTIVPKVRGQGR
jgi:hypothetical protein